MLLFTEDSFVLNINAFASDSSQLNKITSTNITIIAGNKSDKYDSNGNLILHPSSIPGNKYITFDSSANGRTAELPVGTLISLSFPGGPSNVTITPSKGILERVEGKYKFPQHVIGLYRISGPGTVKIKVETTYKSANYSNLWSGYYQTGSSSSFTDTSSYWIAPTPATCISGATSEATWVGIDGAQVGNNTVLQTGTDATCNSSNVESNYAWWEFYPTAPYVIGTGGSTDCTPSAATCGSVTNGDSMYGEVKYNTSSSNWTVTLKNLTQNWNFTTTLSYSGASSSGEFIVEDDSGNPGADMTNYSTISFNNNLINGTNPNFNYSTQSDEITSDGTSTGTPISVPSNPNNLGDAFSVSYGSTPSAPASWINISPTGLTSDQINAISSSSPTNVWEAGFESGSPSVPVTYNYNGSSWTKYYPHSFASANPNTLTGITSDNSGNAWTVGYYTSFPAEQANAYEWSGSSWTHVTADEPSTIGNLFEGVSTDNTGDVYAVGYYNNSGVNIAPLIEKWNGTKFAQQALSLPSGCTSVQLYGVSVFSSSDVLAVGQGSCTSGNKYVIYHYDGTSWTSISGLPTSATSAILYSVKAISSTEAWAVGSKSFSPQQPLIMHYTSGGGWQEDTSNSFGATSISLLTSVDADSSNNVWVAGTLNGNPLTVHYNGSSWTQISTPTLSSPVNVNGVAVNSGIGWLGGYTGSSTFSPFALKSY
ncbi:MAG TPA: hypothetical protein VLF93_06040 [Candidatus Saccharimonadales bacterium]|nr:hypothetical protein [Candidatus Saccharimonadales bacterium]